MNNQKNNLEEFDSNSDLAIKNRNNNFKSYLKSNKSYIEELIEELDDRYTYLSFKTTNLKIKMLKLYKIQSNMKKKLKEQEMHI